MKYETGRLIHYQKEPYLEVLSVRSGFVLAIRQEDAEDFPAPVLLIPDERIVNALKLQRVEDKFTEEAE